MGAADCEILLQIKLVETACTKYLLAMKLPSEQLGQMLQLLQKFSLETSLQELARRYIKLPWTTEIMAELQVIFNYFHKFELLHLMMGQLNSQACGKLCELQVSVSKNKCTLCTQSTKFYC